MEFLDVLSMVRFDLMKKFPYMSKLLLSLQFVKHPVPLPPYSVGIATDKWGRVYWSEELMNGFKEGKVTGEDLKFLLMHEALHIFKLHAQRIRNRDMVRWNIAADLEINDDILQMGLQTNLPLLFPRDYGFANDLTAEQYYEMLLNSEQQSERGQGLGEASGSASDGVQKSWEFPPDIESEDVPPALAKEKIERIVKEVARDILERKGVGNVPLGLLRTAEIYLSTKIPWQDILNTYIMQVYNSYYWEGSEQESYDRVSRRARPELPFIQPGRVGFKPRLGIIVDTSGSMTRKHLTTILSNIAYIAQLFDCMLASADVTLYKETITKVQGFADVPLFKLAGGGGTDMGGSIDSLCEHVDVDLVLVFTDGFSPWKSFAIEMGQPPVIIGLVGEKKERELALKNYMHSILDKVKVVEIDIDDLKGG